LSVPHFFTNDVRFDVVTLTGPEAAHASRALRVRVGEIISVGNGAGGVVTATVEDVGTVVRARVIERLQVPKPRPVLTVYPAVPKSGKLEVVVQKLTELGVERIVPWFAERTVVRWDELKAHANGDRLRAVGFEACKQSRRAWLVEVADPMHLTTVPEGTVVLHEQERGVRLREVLRPEPDAVGIVIGPEGGLSEAEVERLRAGGAIIAGLGEQILRTETAAIVTAALTLSRYGRLG